jgi:hypothetical protein
MLTVNWSGDPPRARAGRSGSPLTVTVTPVVADFDERDPVAAGATVAAEVATGLAVPVVPADVMPGAFAPAVDPDPPDEQPARTNAPATSEPKAAAASR